MFMFVELVYGLYSNSLGLISDAFHMLFDCTALAIGLWAAVIAKWEPNAIFSYGYGRVEVLSGFINALFLIFISFFVFAESLERFIDPPDINSDRLILVSVLGFCVNMVGVFAFHDHGHSHGGDDDGHGHGHSHGHAHNSTPKSPPTSSSLSLPFAQKSKTHNYDEVAIHTQEEHHGHSHGPHERHSHHEHEHEHGHSCDHQEHSHDDHHGRSHHDDHHGHSHHDDHHGHSHHDDHHGHSHNDNDHGHSHNEDHHGHSHNDDHGHHGHGLGDVEEQQDSSHNENMEGIFLHILADTLGSVGVIISSILIYFFNWTIADPICSLCISVMIFFSVLPLLRKSAFNLLQRTPRSFEAKLRRCLSKLQQIEGVVSYREPHFWSYTNAQMVGSIHVTVGSQCNEQKMLEQITQVFKEKGVQHLTVQIERLQMNENSSITHPNQYIYSPVQVSLI
eukprot:TRINITY_DN676_c0_g1_i1.p1 TRINITY_DN676_c0_g1~~TRINITY_DN676_c0_g1_i1.p1  ORF type:complete len:449 (-),score=77.47 TRINITY_DN676_c0_g1_i1:111-1457(-)